MWEAWLDRPRDVVERLHTTLSAEERARAARFRFHRDRDRFVVGRGLLRRLLGAYLGIPAAEVRLVYRSAWQAAARRLGTVVQPLTLGSGRPFSHSAPWVRSASKSSSMRRSSRVSGSRSGLLAGGGDSARREDAVVRLLPALNVTRQTLDEAFEILREALDVASVDG